MQPVGQLEHDHPDVLGHGQDHLADVLGLGHGLGLELHLVILVTPVHDVGHFLAEEVLQFVHVVSVSSTVSWSRPAATVASSSFMSDQDAGHGQGWAR